MLAMRAKRATRSVKRIQEEMEGKKAAVADVATVKFTKPRMKDTVRQKVANQRVRDHGLFVSKKKELQLKRTIPIRKGLTGSDSETDDPD